MRILITFLIITTGLLAQSPQALFEQASADYEQKDYAGALSKYLQISDSIWLSADLYFNMANCYYKSQQIAPAVLYYEKALMLNPNDEDIIFNLKITQLKLVDRLAEVPQPFYKKWMTSITGLLSIDYLAKSGIIMLILFSILFCLFLFSNQYKLKRKSFTYSIFCLALSLGLLSMAYYSFNTIKTEAILMNDNAYIKSAPSMQSEDLFILHEGTKVTVLEQFNDWTKIKLSDGMIGWLESEAIEEI